MSSATPSTDSQLDLQVMLRPVFRRIALGTAITLFILTRLYLLFLFAAPSTDLPVYFNYGVRGVDLGQIAYADFPVEYPPLAYWMVAAPRHLRAESISVERLVAATDLDRPFSNYALKYRSLMVLAEVVSYVLLLKIASHQGDSALPWMAWGYVAVTTPLAPVLHDRMDMGLLLLLLAWAYGRIRSFSAGPLSAWNILSYIALGLSIPFKLVGIVVVPFVILADLRGLERTWDKLRVGAFLAGVCMLVAVFPFAMQWTSSGPATLSFFKYHAERGVEIESTLGSVLMIFSLFGMPIETEISYGSANLSTPLSGALTAVSPYLLLATLAVLTLSTYRTDRPYRIAGYHAGLLAVLLLLVCSKVLSAQYFVFALPLLLLLTIQLRLRWAWFIVPTLMLVAVLTSTVFPYLWFPTYINSNLPNPYCLVPDLDFLPCALLCLRNLLFVALVLGFWITFALGGPPRQSC